MKTHSKPALDRPPIVFSSLWNQGGAITTGCSIVLLLYMILAIISHRPLSRALQCKYKICWENRHSTGSGPGSRAGSFFRQAPQSGRPAGGRVLRWDGFPAPGLSGGLSRPGRGLAAMDAPHVPGDPPRTGSNGACPCAVHAPPCITRAACRLCRTRSVRSLPPPGCIRSPKEGSRPCREPPPAWP